MSKAAKEGRNTQVLQKQREKSIIGTLIKRKRRIFLKILRKDEFVMSKIGEKHGVVRYFLSK